MILDRLENWTNYPLGQAWKTVFHYLSSLAADTPPGEYPLQGEDIFARVMDYATKEPEAAVLEAHRQYVDVQTVLRGAEGMEWFPVQGLSVATSYDGGRDVEFYRRPAPGPARVHVAPGLFVVLFPQDAHMFALIAGDAPAEIRKVVVKVRIDLLKAG